MTNSAIVSYAILKVNWEQPERRDYLDNFILIVAEAIRQLPADIITLEDVQRQVKATFGFEIPQNTIKSLLNRVKRKGYINAIDGLYKRNQRVLTKLNFYEIQQKVLRAHEVLIDELSKFASRTYGLNWSNQQAEDALQEYLYENQVKLLSDLLTHSIEKPFEIVHRSAQNQYVVAKCIQYFQETLSSNLDYLETIIKGNLLANALFMTDPSTFQQKFRNTKILLDAPLVIYALGYAGEPRKWPAIELINLLKKYDAELYIFRHSLEEVIGILGACAQRIRQRHFRNTYGPSIEYFIEKGYSEVDVMMFIENLESDLRRLGIEVRDKPSYIEHEHIINEVRFTEYLREKVGYLNDLPLERDKDSISAIVRLRRGQTYIAVEDCRAIFVTSNRHLANCTRDYDEFNYQLGTAPLGITDYELTNLVWLKNPTLAPSLPRKRLIADSYAAIQPNDSLWSKYLETIDQLEGQNKVTSDQYFVLRHSIQAKSELMERTLGDETVFSEGTVSEILESAEDRLRAKDVARANAEAFAKQEVLLRLEDERGARQSLEEQIRHDVAERRTKIKHRSSNVAKFITRLGVLFLILILGYLTYATSPIRPLNIDPSNQSTLTLKNIALIVFWVLLIMQTLNLAVGFMPKMLLDRLEQPLAQWIEKVLFVD